MENLEALTNRSLRAYELGRLRMATRIAVLLIPVLALCLVEPVGREGCACCGGLLLALAVWSRFRDRAGVDSVGAGLLAGAIPLLASLVLAKFDPGCASAGTLSYCSAFSVLFGAVAGVIIARREARAQLRSDRWLLAAGVAALAASLGCARLGIASTLGVALGILGGRVIARFSRAM